MPAAMQTELTLPADTRLARLAQDFMGGLANLAGLAAEQAKALAGAVWEACKHSIDKAFDEEDRGSFRLVGELTPGALTLAVHDKGLPFCQLPDPAAGQSEIPACFPGRGLYLMHGCADEVRWINHGPEGNELRLTKYLAGVCLLEATAAGAAGWPHDAARGTHPTYDIRLLRSSDGVRLAQLIYRVYGYSYSNEDFYFPERLDHDLETGRHVGVVAGGRAARSSGTWGWSVPTWGLWPNWGNWRWPQITGATACGRLWGPAAGGDSATGPYQPVWRGGDSPHHQPGGQ